MITIAYTVAPENVEDEKDWLRLQKVIPTIEQDWDWVKNKPIIRFGMIVGPDAALAIKLRHNLDLQTKYVPR